MLSLEECLSGINDEMRTSKKDVWKNQMQTNKPLTSFGRLEQIGYQMSRIIGINRKKINKTIVVFAGDHGVAEMDLSVYKQSQTRKVVCYLSEGKTPLNKIANQFNVEIQCIDVGLNGLVERPGILNRKIRNGTNNIYKEDAMTEEDVIQAIEVGIEIAELCKKSDIHIVALGEIGIGNTISASALTAVW